MSYQVLARKWRPKNFKELVGQEQTARALINALDSQRLHHAFLFTGTRGVGKTTIARIFSKSLNCEQGITSQPCGQCSSCQEIDQGRFVDLMEIDAASKTGVDNMRELIDNVQYKPTRGRYKVYLIDEVHMLSTSSFNALLKTLEEPPPHVVFLLATTDPKKLPVTVLSRCLQFHLKRMELHNIVSHLAMILEQEKINYDQGSLTAIANAADGSMRDALSLLDQAIVFCGDQLAIDDLLEMLGSVEQHFIFDLLDKIVANDAVGLISVIQKMAQFSPDYIEVMNDWLSLLHEIAVAQATEQVAEGKTEEYRQTLAPADLQLYYQLSLQAKQDLPYAPNLRQGFEMAMLRVLSFRPNFYVDADPTAKKKSARKTISETQTSTNSSCASDNSTRKLTSVAAVEPFPQAQSTGQKQRISETIHLPSNQPTLSEPLADVVNIVQPSEMATNDSNLQTRQNGNALQVAEPLAEVESDAIRFEQIDVKNWHQVIEQLKIAGTGLQLLLNSLPDIGGQLLTIRYSEKMSHLLTDSLQRKILARFHSHFNTNQLNLEFIKTNDLQTTPKDRQIKQKQTSIDSIHHNISQNPCIRYLLKETGAVVNKENITLQSSVEDRHR